MMRYKNLILLFAFFSFIACEQAQEQALLYAPAASAGQFVKSAPHTTTQIVFQSTDGGQSWQNMSAGLPAGVEPGTFFANDGALFLGAAQGLYRNAGPAKSDVWERRCSSPRA